MGGNQNKTLTKITAEFLLGAFNTEKDQNYITEFFGKIPKNGKIFQSLDYLNNYENRSRKLDPYS